MSFARAKETVRTLLKSGEFDDFYSGKIKGLFPVAILPSLDMEALNSTNKVVVLSSRTLSQHKTAHPEIRIDDYRKIPEIVAHGEAYKQNDARMIYLWEDDVLYRASLKKTMLGNEIYFLTLFKTNAGLADKQVRRRYQRIR